MDKRTYQTKIYSGEFRAATNQGVEQKVTVIQHRKVGENQVRIRDIWEPVSISGVEINCEKEILPSNKGSVIYLFPKGYRTILFTNKFTLDKKRVLAVEIILFAGDKITKNLAFALDGLSRLVACPKS